MDSVRIAEQSKDAARFPIDSPNSSIDLEPLRAGGAPHNSVVVAMQLGASQLGTSHLSAACSAIIGQYSCHGTSDFRPKVNQDAGSVSYPDDSSAILLSVLDGHGADGSAVSSRAMTSMIAVLGGGGAESKRLREDPAAALTAAFEAAQTQLVAAALRKELDANHSGACSLVAYVREQTLWIANAGDCACVLATAQANTTTASGKKAVQSGSRYVARKLSMEHKVDEPNEKTRLEASGAWVRPTVYEADGLLSCPARLYRCKGEDSRRFGPGLAISRALGDIDAVSCGLIFTPDVQKHTLQAIPAAADGTPSDAEHDAFLILASDGVWEFLSAQAACDLVAPIYARGGTAAEACKALIEQAQQCWKADDDEYSDDITAIVVFIPALLAALGTGIPLF